MLFFLCILLTFFFSSLQSSNKNYSSFSEWTSETLDNLLVNYDKHIRPDIGYKPTEISANLNIRSMGPISEQEMSYSFDCYFRQFWNDKRLKFNPLNTNTTIKTLQLNNVMLKNIWKPDTYFVNGKKSNLHMLTTPNVLFRITHDGHVSYSMRLTLHASCAMDLIKYPMDEQVCGLIISSYGYANHEVVYKWGGAGSDKTETYVQINQEMKLSQFQLRDLKPYFSNKTYEGRGNYSILEVKFYFKRNTGYFLLQIYLPCSLLVVMSWVGFWINREATADRIALGIMTVLTMVFMGMDNKKDLPKVPYSTALDVYVAACFAFILATIIEFAFVHYFTKVGYGEFYSFMNNPNEDSTIKSTDTNPQDHSTSKSITNKPVSNTIKPAQNNAMNGEIRRGSLAWIKKYDDRLLTSCIACVTGSVGYRTYKQKRGASSQFNSVSQIDRISRILFPFAFSAFNLCYWVLYLHIL